MFTQWVPHTYADAPHAAATATRTPTALTARMEAVAPGFTDSIVGRQVIGPHQMQNEYGLVGGNIFHGELTPGQMFHAGRPPGTPICVPRSRACTRPDRPPTAAAGSPAYRAATWSGWF